MSIAPAETPALLSFMAKVGDVVCHWEPQREASYEVECANGRRYADELLRYMDQTDNPVIFGTVIRAMVAGGKYGAAEIGFCSAIGIELLGVVG